jgi:hypothetical protein
MGFHFTVLPHQLVAASSVFYPLLHQPVVMARTTVGLRLFNSQQLLLKPVIDDGADSPSCPCRVLAAFCRGPAVCAAAAAGGHTHVLAWLRQQVGTASRARALQSWTVSMQCGRLLSHPCLKGTSTAVRHAAFTPLLACCSGQGPCCISVLNWQQHKPLKSVLLCRCVETFVVVLLQGCPWDDEATF